jgi:hypothetical protein
MKDPRDMTWFEAKIWIGWLKIDIFLSNRLLDFLLCFEKAKQTILERVKVR